MHVSFYIKTSITNPNQPPRDLLPQSDLLDGSRGTA